MDKLCRSILAAARFYDKKKVGDIGPLGFRRSTDLMKLYDCISFLLDQRILIPGESRFLDMGCADGRVNVLFSYLTEISVGIELDEWNLDEYTPLKKDLEKVLKEENLLLPPDNISLFHGNSIDQDLYRLIKESTGIGFEDFDLFYTYLTMHEEFADYIARNGKGGAVFMVYGLDKIIPKYSGFTLLTPNEPRDGILALYRKDFQ